jgi:hypothetical protein
LIVFVTHAVEASQPEIECFRIDPRVLPTVAIVTKELVFAFQAFTLEDSLRTCQRGHVARNSTTYNDIEKHTAKRPDIRGLVASFPCDNLGRCISGCERTALSGRCPFRPIAPIALNENIARLEILVSTLLAVKIGYCCTETPNEGSETREKVVRKWRLCEEDT